MASATFVLQAVLLVTFPLKPAPPPPDAATLLPRVAKECPAGSKSEACRALRLQVESAFLASLMESHAAGVKAELAAYRTAARARTPELAAIGLREIMANPARTAEDDAIIASVLDSPYPGLRRMVIMQGNQLPPVKNLVTRVQQDGVRYDSAMGISLLAGGRDLEPDPKRAGAYPGARYRPFASGPSRLWFTTPDPPEKVVAALSKGGKKVQTTAEVQAAAKPEQVDPMALQKKMMEAVENQDTEAMQALMESASKPKLPEYDWSNPLEGMEGTGEIRYVSLGERQVVAVFRDDVLKATSIVALAPPQDQPTDMDKLAHDAIIRSVYGN